MKATWNSEMKQLVITAPTTPEREELQKMHQDIYDSGDEGHKGCLIIWNYYPDQPDSITLQATSMKKK